MSWNGRVAHPNSVCAEFGHVVDVAPTLLEAAGLPTPETVFGVRQKPMDGRSLLQSLTTCAPERPRTQYFEIAGKVGFYQDGWFLSGDDGRWPWQRKPPGGDAPATTWALYDLRTDFSQSTDLAGRHPQRVKAMVDSWRAVAIKNNVYPIDHTGPQAPRGPHSHSTRMRYDYWGGDVSIPKRRGPNFVGQSFTLDADLQLGKADASGAILAIGSRFGGWSLYLDEGRPALTYALSTRPEDITTIRADRRLPAGDARIGLAFKAAGAGKSAEVQLLSDGAVIAHGRIPRTFLTAAGSGEMLDIGRDTGAPVTEYKTPEGRFDGEVRRVSISLAK